MNYSLAYNRLIERGQIRQFGHTKKSLTLIIGYTERHHVVPRCMGGTNESDNLVYLTPEEHYVAHGLLVKIHPNEKKLINALVILSGRSKNRNNKLYGWARRLYAEKKKRQVSIRGIIYNSLREAAVAMGFGDNYNRVTNRCNSDLHPDWFFLEILPKRKKKIGTPKPPMTEESKIKMRESIGDRIPWNKDKPGSQVPWNKGLKTKIKPETKPRSNPVSCDGIVYDSIIAAVKAHGITRRIAMRMLLSEEHPTWFFV